MGQPRATHRRLLPALGRTLGHRDVRAADLAANTGVLSGYRRDASVRSVGIGWRELASEIEAVRAREGATCVLALDYGTHQLAFLLSAEGQLRGAARPAFSVGQYA